MKSHERLKAEGRIEREIEHVLYDEGYVNSEDILHDPAGDFLIEVKAHYLGSKTRLKEPHVD